MLALLTGAPASAGDPEPAATAGAVTTDAQLQSDLARARQEITALRATGDEMQRSLDARDAALAELRGRIDTVLAAADERAERLTVERDEVIARIAVLERRLGELSPTAAAEPAKIEKAAVELAVLKAGSLPTPVGKPAALPSATPDVADGPHPAPAAGTSLALVMTGGLADLHGVEAAGMDGWSWPGPRCSRRGRRG